MPDSPLRALRASVRRKVLGRSKEFRLEEQGMHAPA